MRVTLLPSSASGDRHNQYLTSFLINGAIAVDAGGLGLCGTPSEQARIRHVLITHTHIDHIATLPIFVENAYEDGPDCVSIYGSDEVLDCLRQDIFNDRVWPDFERISRESPSPFLKLEPLRPEEPLVLDGLKITPVPVDHLVPTLGLLIEDAGASVVIASDTGPTDLIWRKAHALPRLKAVFLEAAFPNELAGLADVSKHLTPVQFGAEVRKLPESARVFAVHIKSKFRERIMAELEALNLPNLEICEPGRVYSF